MRTQPRAGQLSSHGLATQRVGLSMVERMSLGTSGRIGIGVGTVIASVAACSTSAEVIVETPDLEGFTVQQVPFRFRGNWGAYVSASVTEGTLTLSRDSRVPFSISTDSGDFEQAFLRPVICDAESSGPYQCLEFMFSMEEGHHVQEVADRIDEVDAELRYVAYSGWFASAVIYDGDVDRALRNVRSWPGVVSASRIGFFYPTALSDPQARALGLFLRLELASPIVGDGIIQASAGEVVTVVYDAPPGTEQISTFVTCESIATGDVLEGGAGNMPPCA